MLAEDGLRGGRQYADDGWTVMVRDRGVAGVVPRTLARVEVVIMAICRWGTGRSGAVLGWSA